MRRCQFDGEAICDCRSDVMVLERRLISAAGGRTTTDTEIEALELVIDDCISAFHVAARGADEILMDTPGGATYTWLCAREDTKQDSVELYLGSALAGSGYRGVPLTTHLICTALLPFHQMYARVLVAVASNGMVSPDA